MMAVMMMTAPTLMHVMRRRRGGWRKVSMQEFEGRRRKGMLITGNGAT